MQVAITVTEPAKPTRTKRKRQTREELLAAGSGTIAARYMPLVRSKLYLGPRPSKDWKPGGDVRILRSLLKRGAEPDELTDAILGLAWLRDQGGLTHSRPHTPITTRPLSHFGLYRVCVHAAQKWGLV